MFVHQPEHFQTMTYPDYQFLDQFSNHHQFSSPVSIPGVESFKSHKLVWIAPVPESLLWKADDAHKLLWVAYASDGDQTLITRRDIICKVPFQKQ